MVAPQKRQSFNNGTEGDLVSNTNTATSGDALAAPVIAGTGSAVFAASAAIRGAKGCRVTGAVNDTYTLILTGTAAGSASGQIYFTVDSARSPGTAGAVVARFRSASANVAILVLGTTRVLSIQNSAGTGLKNFNGNTALPDGDYVANIQTTKGTTTTDGFIACQVYNISDTGTAIDTYSASNVNSGTADITQFQAGKPVSTGSVDMDIDEMAFSTGTTAALDFVASNVAPTVAPIANQNVSAGATVNLTAVPADSDGSIASISWTFDYPSSGAPTLTGATTNTPSFTAGAAGSLYILRATATDNNGATGFTTVEVRVPRAGNVSSRPLPVATTGATWTNVGGAATAGQALSDESDATYLESPSLSATETAVRIRLDPSNARATSSIKQRLWTDTGTANVTVRLYEGTTLRQSWTQAVTSTATEYTFALSGATLSAITDWGNLYLEVGATT